MPTVTPSFNWPVPVPTDLVKDGATAIESLGDAIDASLTDLKGGTTGQVLAKASNTDMDFSWVAQDDSNAIQNTIVDAKGDLIAASASDTPARLGVGANDLLLIAASGESTGLKWGGGWTSYTPTLSNWTLGNGTLDARFSKIGKNVTVYFSFTFGSTSSIANFANLSLPVTAQSGAYESYGNCVMNDSGVGIWVGGIYLTGGVAYPRAMISSGAYVQDTTVGATVPFTWTTNDLIRGLFTYEGQ
jgi:hypothetical protein